MKNLTLLMVVPMLALPVYAAADGDAEAALTAVKDLGLANGQALACKDNEAAARAKSLMLRHAPRTSRYGESFEQATQEGFLAQVKSGTPCPGAQVLAARLESIASRLRESLPTIESK